MANVQFAAVNDNEIRDPDRYLCAGDGDYTKWDTRLASQKPPLRVKRSTYVERQQRKNAFVSSIDKTYDTPGVVYYPEGKPPQETP